MDRVAYGTECFWWDLLSEAGVVRTPFSTRFRCPHCGGPVAMHPSKQEYLDLARRFEIIGFEGHQALIVWSQGKHFRTRQEAWQAFRSESLRSVPTLVSGRPDIMLTVRDAPHGKV